MIEAIHVKPREWNRFTPAERLLRFAFYFLSVAAIVFSLKNIEIVPEYLLDAPAQLADFFQRMWPLDTPYYAKSVHAALIETLNIATVGTLLSLTMAIPIGIMAAKNVVPYRLLNWLAQLILITSRSVNTLVWALLFIAIFGPGALAGTMAIAFRSVGFIGKLFGESLDDSPTQAIDALKATGASPSGIFLKGYWPQVKPAFASLVLFRWDINVRESAVLGLVGAGGIGMAMDSAMNLFRWDQVAVVLITIFVVVIVAEILVTMIRRRII